ncbi:MAG TPA: hypothetical protein VFI14_04890 [Chryseosolibacter sp.]|nr:hypothetical protein [Chryseosolibacter sp.]
MKKYLYIPLACFIASSVCGQTTDDGSAVSFDSLINYFQKFAHRYPLSGQLNDSTTRSSLYRTEAFNVSISDNPIAFDTNHVVVVNPYYKDDFDDYDDNYINYPVSYSVIYEERLVSLFRNGKFVCHSLPDLQRDLGFEAKLNTKKFKYHWIIDGKLGAISRGRIYVWDGNAWMRLKSEFPLKAQPKLFEDNDFIVFGECNGEFGGTLYFFDKRTHKTYFTESTCTNSVLRKDAGYFVLADLGHMMGSTQVKLIRDPTRLTEARRNEIGKPRNGASLGYADKSKAYEVPIDLYGIQIFSTFNYEDRQLYIVNLIERTFLAEIKDGEVQIVHPLFDDGLYTHNPVTTSYGKYTLINLDFYGTARDKEVSVILLHGNKITKMDWNEEQLR